MSKNYVIVDALNMFFRARHVVRGDIDTKVGMAMHIMFNSINKAYKDFQGDHVVICFDGSSWRKEVYAPYKRNRAVARAALTPIEVEEDQAFFDSFKVFQEFMEQRSNCTVLKHDRCEADDFIARWIQTHPDDTHVIVSSDSDFYQLLAPNVHQYNGVSGELITLDGVYDDRGKPIIDKKTKQKKQIGEPEWLLFEKCVRGDKSDNIFSAYPGVRTKGTKNKVGLMEAFADRNDKGFNWNNLMLQTWTDHEGEEHKVLDRYNINKQIIDLTAQPQWIIDELDKTIINAVTTHNAATQIGANFMRFCGKYELIKISDNAQQHVKYLMATYK